MRYFRRLLRRQSLETGRARQQSILGNESGSMVIMAAFLLIPLVLTIGAGIDMGRAYLVHTHLAAALDAAVVSVSRDLRDGKINKNVAKERAQALFDVNTKRLEAQRAVIDELTIVYNEKDTDVRVVASAVVPTTFMQIGGFEEIPMSLEAQVTYSFSYREVELAMILDVTGSMGSRGRISALKDAARDLVDTLIPDDNNMENVRISIVPYSQGVNAGSYAKTATDGASKSCATERLGTEQFTDESYIIAPIGNGSTRCPSNKVRPLTKNKSVLVDDINNLRTGGYTAGHTGIAWGWYTLSPNWTALWPSEDQAKPYPVADDKDNLLKAAIIMTDGEFNTAYVKGRRGSGHRELKGRGASTAETRTRALCEEMKKKQVRIYSVAFNAGRSAERLLKYCATNESTYFTALNAAKLKEAFRVIAADIGTFWLSQ